jgi:hypothetical protein
VRLAQLDPADQEQLVHIAPLLNKLAAPRD